MIIVSLATGWLKEKDGKMFVWQIWQGYFCLVSFVVILFYHYCVLEENDLF